MATFNYNKTADTALRLLTKFGRAVILARRTGTYDPVAGSTTGGSEAQSPATVVNLPASQSINQKFQNTFLEASQKGQIDFYLVAAKGLTFAPEGGDLLLIDGSYQDVKGATELSPSGTPVLYWIATSTGGTQ
jgi:hypothetical protein